MLTIPQKRQERSKSVKRRPLCPHTFFIERQIFEGVEDSKQAWKNLIGQRGKAWIEEEIEYEIKFDEGHDKINVFSSDQAVGIDYK